MRLQRISVKNYKGLKDQVFEPARFTCLVGENNAGKSSVMQAAVTALRRPSQLPATQYYDPALPVEFEFCVSDIDESHLARAAEEHRTKIRAMLVNDTLTFCLRYPPGEKYVMTAKRLVPADARYREEAVTAALEGKKGAAAILNAINDAYPEFVAAIQDTPTSLASAKAFLKEQISKLPHDQLVSAEGPLPTGIPAAMTNLLPEPIYIPAVKDLNDELKTTQSTSFGRLLGLLLADMASDLDQIGQSLLALNQMLNRVNVNGEAVDQRHAKVRALESRVEAFLGENFPAAKVHLHIPPPELKTILNTAQIFIDDGSRDLVDNKGDGIKRSLTFALLQAYVQHLEQRQVAIELENAPAPQPLLFLFEEPELYLHPKSQRVLFNTLARISHSHQVVVTTHSPLFFEPGVTAAFVRVAKRQAQPKPEGVLHPVNFELNQVSAETFRLARFEHADAAFFSRRVVLFEGESDDAYCRHVAMLLDESWDFEQQNIALVRVSGKGNFKKFRTFFESFGIDVKLVADLDAIFEGFQHLSADEATGQLRNAVLQILDARIQHLQVKAEPTSKQIQKRVQQGAWKAKYEVAKNALREVQQSGVVNEGILQALDGLFTWEQTFARQKVCLEDAEAATALVPLLDTLRAQGICVLSRGAIEDYYPKEAPATGAKPDRALTACSYVTSKVVAKGLSTPLDAGRRTELEEILEELFS